MTVRRELKDAALNIKYTVSVRCFGSYEQVNEAWSKLLQFAFRYGIAGQDVVSFGITYDAPGTPPGANELRYDACFAISRQHFEDLQRRAAELPEGVRLEALRFGRSYMLLHRGPFPSIRAVYPELVRVASAQGAPVIAGPPFVEVYRSNPMLTRPDELITELHLLVS